MATAFATYIIHLGTPTVVTPSLVLLGIGAEGTVGASRIMTHPDAVNFPPVTYYKNPDFSTNIDNEVLTAPRSTAVQTLSSTKLVRFETGTDDTIITETWEGSRGARASMPTFLFRQLYELLVNPPEFDSQNQTYVTWQPRDRNTKTYDIQLFEVTVGGGDAAQAFKMQELRYPNSTNVKHPLESLDVSPTGVLTDTVSVRFRVVQETP